MTHAHHAGTFWCHCYAVAEKATGPKDIHIHILSKNNVSLVSTLAAAHTLRLDLSVHVSRAEGRPIYSVGPCAQVISFSLKHMMASEITYQKVRLCQRAFKKINKLCLFDFFNNMTSHVNTSHIFQLPGRSRELGHRKGSQRLLWEPCLPLAAGPEAPGTSCRRGHYNRFMEKAHQGLRLGKQSMKAFKNSPGILFSPNQTPSQLPSEGSLTLPVA